MSTPAAPVNDAAAAIAGGHGRLPSVWMQDLTWPEVEAHLRDDRIAIVPIGSTEQHGPAGPCCSVRTATCSSRWPKTRRGAPARCARLRSGSATPPTTEPFPALVTAARELHDQELAGVVFAVADPLHLARSAAARIKEATEHHAGELELSQAHYRFPGTVRVDRLTDAHVDFIEAFGGFVGDDLFGPHPMGWVSSSPRPRSGG